MGPQLMNYLFVFFFQVASAGHEPATSKIISLRELWGSGWPSSLTRASCHEAVFLANSFYTESNFVWGGFFLQVIPSFIRLSPLQIFYNFLELPTLAKWNESAERKRSQLKKEVLVSRLVLQQYLHSQLESHCQFSPKYVFHSTFDCTIYGRRFSICLLFQQRAVMIEDIILFLIDSIF